MNREERNQIKKLNEFSDKRKLRALGLFDKGIPITKDSSTYLVPSESDPEKYYIVRHYDSYSCTCDDFKLRVSKEGVYCKHIQAVILFEKIKEKIMS